MAFNYQAAKQAGYSDQEIQDYLKSQGGQDSPQSPLSDLFSGNFSQYPKDVSTNALKTLGFTLDDQGKINGTDPNQIQNTGMGVGGSDIAAVTGKELSSLLGYLSKSSVGNKIGKAAQAATDKGVSLDWSKTAQKIEDQAIKKFGNGAEVRQAISDFLGKVQPTGNGQVGEVASGIPMDAQPPTGLGQNSNNYSGPLRDATPYSANPTTDVSNTQLSPNDYLAKRRQISTMIPNSYFSQLANMISSSVGKQSTNSQLNNSIADIARRTVSQDLKGAVPDIVKPDKMYSFYSKYGSPVDWTKAYLTGELLKHTPAGRIPILGDLLRSIPGP